MTFFRSPAAQAKTQDFAPAITDVRPIIRWTYLWMLLGLLVSSGVAIVTASSTTLLMISVNPLVGIVSLVATFGLLIFMHRGLATRSVSATSTMFFLFCALMGFSLAFVLYAYSGASIAYAFLSATMLFGVMSVFAYTTSIDLTKYSSYFFMGLIGLLLTSFVNILLRSSGLEMLISAFGVLLFTGLIAYDTQRVRQLAAHPQLQDDGSLALKLSIMLAVSLYLNFLNLFLFLLRLFGGGRD